jgi:endonuclease/exonuclease/phosphatase family metal-dependent hydrolase
VRIIAWNIRAGGGRRASGIADQIRAWDPDLIALSEFRGTPASRTLAEELADASWPHQRTTAAHRRPEARENALLVASRWPLRRHAVRRMPANPRRWLLTRIEIPTHLGGALTLGAMHAPNEVTGHKWPLLDALLDTVRHWRGGPALLIGDTNTGRPLLDEESPVFGDRHEAWMHAMHRRWPDALRLHAGDEARAYTWYSPNAGNGFRLDEAFLHPALASRLLAVHHTWGAPSGAAPDAPLRREALSDHAALILDFAPPSLR